MKRVSSSYLPEAEPVKKLQLEKTREFESDLPVELFQHIISLGSLFLRVKTCFIPANNPYAKYFETRSLVSKKWFEDSNKAAAQFLNSNFDMQISANMIFTNEMRIKNFLKRFGVRLESFILSDYYNYGSKIRERNYTLEDIACLPNLTTIYYNNSNQTELESIAEKCKKIKNVILGSSCDVKLSNSILSGFEKIESLGVFSVYSFNMKAMAEKFSNVKYLKVTWFETHKNELIKGKFPLLEELDLGGSGTDDAGLAEIKDSFPLLKKLSLSYCKITNLKVINQSFPFLEVLNLQSCDVHLADIKYSYPFLQELHLSSNTANKELNNICNSFPLLIRLYLLSNQLNFEVLLNFAKERPKNKNLTIYIEVNEYDFYKDCLVKEWNKKIVNLFPHIKIVLLLFGQDFPFFTFSE